jgi:hypothetical protein
MLQNFGHEDQVKGPTFKWQRSFPGVQPMGLKTASAASLYGLW